MKKSTQTLLLYIAEAVMEDLQSDSTDEDRDEMRILGKRVEAMGRYVQARGTGLGYMKMTKSEFLSLHQGDEYYEEYEAKAYDIESEGGFLPE